MFRRNNNYECLFNNLLAISPDLNEYEIELSEKNVQKRKMNFKEEDEINLQYSKTFIYEALKQVTQKYQDYVKDH